jgi:two-component system chemotaxis response regulator CheV
MNREEMLQFVVFDLSAGKRSLTMAINVQKVKEVFQMESLSSFPSGDNNTIGILDLRGCPVPVLNIQKLISKQDQQNIELKAGDRILICDLQNILIGIPVERTGRMIRCVGSDFVPPPAGSKIENTRIVTGLIRREGSYIPVLDIDSLIELAGYQDEFFGGKQLPAGIFSGKRVLVVDDSKVVLKRLDQIFSQLGCTSVMACNGEDGLQKLMENEFKFDLIFTDIEMPSLDGIAMARKIKENPQSENIPILFNSALSNPALIRDIEKEGLGTYLVKFDEGLILSQLRSVFKI